jgi:hypothetical protein
MKTAFKFICLLLATLIPAQAQTVEQLQRQFAAPPDDAKIMMRWWWFGPTVTQPEIERELRVMKEGGIGGVEIQPVYPVVLDDEASGLKTLPYLSDEFIDAMRFANDKARELGLRVDLTIGSGWPFGGPSVSISDAAGRLKVERVKITADTKRVPVPSIGSGEKLITVFLARTEGQAIAAEGTHEIGGIKDGVLTLPANLNGANEVLFFISSRTGQQVKRPSVGAEGFVLNHYDRAATERYLKNVGDRLLQAFGDKPPTSVFCDSLEVYLSDWTPDLLSEFQKRRGYDLKPLLPALVGDFGPQTAGVRHDWGLTLTELLNERFITPMREWAHRHKTLFRIQGYGIPPATISSNSFADLPEGEGPQWKVVRASRWASSASHIYGRNVTSSETWTWLHSPSFRATPLDIKAEADLHFLQGINQLIGHGWPYTAPGVEYPGWRFYAAAVFDEKNPWYLVMPDLAAYLQRVSFLLRQGQPANDIALYLPNADAYSHFSNGKVHLIDDLKQHLGDDVMAKIIEAGYNLDFFDDDALKNVGKVDGNALALGPHKYKVVILPNVERIPLETLKKLEEFATGGGIVVATKRIPALAPGLKATEADHQQVAELAKRLFEGANAPAHFVADEKTQLAPKLNSLLRPDVEFSGGKMDLGLIHRHTDNAEIYFVANSSNIRQNIKATFRVSGLQAELWDPFTGNVESAASQLEAGGVTVPLDLEPYGSRVVVFTKRKRARPAIATATNAHAPLDLSTGWRVSFDQTGQKVTMNRLHSWADDEETRYYSGTATYEKEISVPEVFLQKGLTVKLDFGEGKPVETSRLTNGMRAWLDGPVRDAAVVYVNDQRAGSVWMPPYSVDVTRLLKPGQNRIKVVVGNTAMNYMAGHRLPDYRLLVLRYGDRFQPQDMDKVKPLPSGLMGPVRLIAESAKE